ncbi:MAG: hypothetical protein ACYS8K_07185 [Planctomycetota bacterium]|jgi:hypothetical protein
MAVKQDLKRCTESGKKGGPPGRARNDPKAQWKKPVLEDVSGKVMAQPYIRFT